MMKIDQVESGIFMRIEVDGVRQKRKCYIEDGITLPELKQNEQLFKFIGGDIIIVTIPR